MKYEFMRPKKGNVELGDLLIMEANNRMFPVPITGLSNVRISARGSWISGNAKYEDAVVLKQDGSYLVGERAEEQLREPIGARR